MTTNKVVAAMIHPLGDRLKILPLVPREMTAAGILMPERALERERPMEGIVLAVGRGRVLDSGVLVQLECAIGDVVQFGKYAGLYVFDEVLGYDVLLMREDEALGRKHAIAIELVRHESAESSVGAAPHVTGDPRCSICRAGGAGAASSAAR